MERKKHSLREVIRIALTSHLTHAETAHSAGCSRNTIKRYRRIAAEEGITWHDVRELSDVALAKRFNKSEHQWQQKRHPNWEDVRKEVQIDGKTLTVAWEDYRLVGPSDALQYSQFAELYRKYVRKLRISMRQIHKPGEKLFVDFSGKRPFIVDPVTGTRAPQELFVAVMGRSAKTFALATPSQGLRDWINANRSAFEFYGGVTQIVVPDNLKSGVTRPGAEPVINRTYEEFSEHYGFVVVPARGYRPKDKAPVEVGVLVVQRWILARLRNVTFFSLEELNEAITKLNVELNARPFKKREGSRDSEFELHDKPALKPLPASPYEFCEWVPPRIVGPDYHLRVGLRHYSVPHRFRGNRVGTRIGEKVIEFFFERQRIAAHVRRDAEGFSTEPAHQPEEHRAQAEHHPENYVAWAATIGASVTTVMKHQFERHRHPALGLPVAKQLKDLVRRHGARKVELAAKRAIEIGSLNVKSVKSLISSPTVARAVVDDEGTLPSHENVRGPEFFNQEVM